MVVVYGIVCCVFVIQQIITTPRQRRVRREWVRERPGPETPHIRSSLRLDVDDE
jgi:hypothetical protein